jgi:mitochondrial import receptor subunit TOM40
MSWIGDAMKKIKEACVRSKTEASFDTYNAEAQAITSFSGYSGIKTEVSKTLSPFLQISKVLILDQKSVLRQIFGTISLPNSLLQLSMDHERSLQLRATHLRNNVTSKMHTIVSRQREVFSQAEVEIRSRANSLVLKMISPALKGTSMIYVVSAFQQLGSSGLGAEVIGTDCSLGISLCGRHETGSSVVAVGLQQFTAMSLSWHHKLGRMIDLGGELQMSRLHPSYAAVGCRLRTHRAELKANINSNRTLAFSYDERLNEGLSFNLNCEIGRGGCLCGFGFSLEF